MGKISPSVTAGSILPDKAHVQTLKNEPFPRSLPTSRSKAKNFHFHTTYPIFSEVKVTILDILSKFSGLQRGRTTEPVRRIKSSHPNQTRNVTADRISKSYDYVPHVPEKRLSKHIKESGRRFEMIQDL